MKKQRTANPSLCTSRYYRSNLYKFTLNYTTKQIVH